MKKSHIIAIIAGLFATGALLALGSILAEDHKLVKEVKSGSKTLKCYIDGDYILITKDKLKAYNEETATWIFTNGSASSRNCNLS